MPKSNLRDPPAAKPLQTITIPRNKPITETSEKRLTKGEIARVIDGDTVVLSSGVTVRLLEIDTPEMNPCWKSNKKCSPDACAIAAKNRLTELLKGKSVFLEKDVEEKDRYGRLLRYIWINELLINEVMAKEGFAKPYTTSPNKKYLKKILVAADGAKQNNGCVWKKA